jgi:hypothetical protein
MFASMAACRNSTGYEIAPNFCDTILSEKEAYKRKISRNTEDKAAQLRLIE